MPEQIHDRTATWAAVAAGAVSLDLAKMPTTPRAR
jgi:hypothetical protein